MIKYLQQRLQRTAALSMGEGKRCLQGNLISMILQIRLRTKDLNRQRRVSKYKIKFQLKIALRQYIIIVLKDEISFELTPKLVHFISITVCCKFQDTNTWQLSCPKASYEHHLRFVVHPGRFPSKRTLF